MNIWFNAIARAGGIEVAPGTGSTAAGPSTRRRRRSAVRDLSALNDHTLKDLGLHRGDIRSVVHEMIPFASDTGSTPAGPSNTHRNGPTLARRILADIGGGGSLQALESRVSRLVQSLNTWRRRRAAVRELSALSDQILKDIGLHRDEIRSVVDEMTHVAAATPGDSPAERKQARRLPLTGAIFGAQPCEQPC